MWPFRKSESVAPQSPPDWREIIRTVIRNRAPQFWRANGAYRASVDAIVERAMAILPMGGSRDEKIDAIELFFEREEFSIFEDICDSDGCEMMVAA